MKKLLLVAAVAGLGCTASLSQATVINSAYTPLGGDSWLVDFTVVNDGSPPSFAAFTIDFPDATNLVLRASPGTWDSAVFQPDASLPDDGFLDSFARSAANVLPVGQSIGGFQVSFSYIAGALPGALPFMVYNDSFMPLSAGNTMVTAIPEPPMVFLAALGLAAVGLRTLRRTKSRKATEEVTA